MSAPDLYWQHDLSLGENVFSHVPHALRMRLHVGKERYAGRQEIVQVTQPEGERTAVHARPYSLLPHGLSRRLPFLGTLIRRVTKANWERLEYKELGDCHAWYYATDRLLMLWDCVLSENEKDPQTDQTLSAVWNGFERFLLSQFPDTVRIATPSWEPVYKTPDWQAFLITQGYAAFNTQAFLKEVAKPEPRLRR